MAKKSFSIPSDLASGIRNSVQSASGNQGQLHYEMMSVEVIERDPNNPRKLLIGPDDLFQALNPSDKDYQTKLKQFEELQDLANSIKKIGVRNAIEVYREGNKYRIITGERRYLASLLASQRNIPVRINERLSEFSLRYTQWVENINRQDLSIWEKYNNLLQISNAYESDKKESITAKILQDLLGVGRSQAFLLFSLLKADPEVLSLIKVGKLLNLKVINELEAIKDSAEKRQILEKISQLDEKSATLSTFKKDIKAPAKHFSRKKRASYNLGVINNVKVIQHLFNILLADKKLSRFKNEFSNLDWGSTKSVIKAFKALLKAIEEGSENV